MLQTKRATSFLQKKDTGQENNQIKMKTLESFRKQIDRTDKQLIKILERRFAISRQIGRFKKANKMPIKNGKRELAIIENRTKETRLNPKFTKKLFKLIFKESRRLQK